MNLLLDNRDSYQSLLTDISHITTLTIRRERGDAPILISKRQAYKIYGRGIIDLWLNQGIVQERVIQFEKKQMRGLDTLDLDIAYRSTKFKR